MTEGADIDRLMEHDKDCGAPEGPGEPRLACDCGRDDRLREALVALLQERDRFRQEVITQTGCSEEAFDADFFERGKPVVNVRQGEVLRAKFAAEDALEAERVRAEKAEQDRDLFAASVIAAGKVASVLATDRDEARRLLMEVWCDDSCGIMESDLLQRVGDAVKSWPIYSVPGGGPTNG